MDIALMLLRVGLGAILACHASQKALGWFNGPGLATSARVFETLGHYPGRRKVRIAVTCEVVSATLLIVGFGTSLAAAIAVATMLVAGASQTLKARTFWNAQGGGEYPLVLAFVAACVGFSGPGKYSVDAALFGNLPSYTGLLVIALAALASAPPLFQAVRFHHGHDRSSLPIRP